jgi:hypothetical protein
MPASDPASPPAAPFSDQRLGGFKFHKQTVRDHSVELLAAHYPGAGVWLPDRPASGLNRASQRGQEALSHNTLNSIEALFDPVAWLIVS